MEIYTKEGYTATITPSRYGFVWVKIEDGTIVASLTDFPTMEDAVKNLTERGYTKGE